MKTVRTAGVGEPACDMLPFGGGQGDDAVNDIAEVLGLLIDIAVR